MQREVRDSKPTRLLVTGVGGGFGQGIVKALRLGSRPAEINGCDLVSGGIGAAFVDAFHAVPPAGDEKSYLSAVERLCARFKIDAVIPGSPAEIETLGRFGSPPMLPSGVPVICLASAYRDIYDDKLRCYQALDGKVDLAPYADGADPEAVGDFVQRHGFPLVVKPRRGGGDVHVVRGSGQLASAIEGTRDPVLQGFVDDTGGGEYSIGIFSADGGRTVIAFHRRPGLTGSSWFAETSDDAEILAYGRAIARASKLRGSANVQVRRSSKGIRLLEVNARFTSLAPALAYAGFRDVEWSVDLALGRAPDLRTADYRRFRFQRFVHEMVDDGSGFRPVPEWNTWAATGTPPGPRRRAVSAGLKRSTDVALSVLGLILLAPVMALVALAIRIGMGSPVLYLRRRPGRGGKPFTLLKFRTMLEGDLPNAQRMTRLGGFLRSTSLDELPQLWNVLRGDMSLVGPRPLMPQYLGRYTREQGRRHEVRPGITGWAQVNGRNALDWEQRFKLDVWYVDHASMGLDLRILLLTVGKVFSRSGVANMDSGVETEFLGSRTEATRNA